ncbi:MAG TPA: hypothetical protein DEW46_10880 [Verrucomicrobia bacterium]|mgnify:CR=1 FL=1|nr:hypothetical protein [Verrucomicrobiota bacterium]
MRIQRLFPNSPGIARGASSLMRPWLAALTCVLAVTLPPAALKAAVYEINDPVTNVEVDGVQFFYFNPGSASGSGTFYPFLRLQSNVTQRGYNTDGAVEFDTKSGTHTRSLLLSSIPKTVINGIEYYELALDHNEADKPISLNELHLLTSVNGNLTGYDPGTHTFASGGSTLAFDMDANEDIRIDLNFADNAGSGASDYIVLVPTSKFSYLADPGSIYLYLYCEFGEPGNASDNGFEEWATIDNGPIFEPGVKIEKYVNGMDADSAPGPTLVVGDPVTWTYYVTNDGTYDLTDVVVSDSDGGLTVVYVSGDTSGDWILDAGETWVYEAQGVAGSTPYMNTGFVEAKAIAFTVTDSDDAHYHGIPTPPVDASVSIEKFTNGQDADTAPGPLVGVPSQVVWTYEVTNTSAGAIALTNVVVTDDVLGPITNLFSGDTGSDGILKKGETWIFQAVGPAIVGQYANIGTVTANAAGTEVMDSDPSHYFGATLPEIAIDKVTNGHDGLEILLGEPVTWTYYVSNPWNLPLQNIQVTDSDPAVVPVYQYGDDGDGQLDPGEIWVFEAHGVAIFGPYANTGSVSGEFHYEGVVLPVSDADTSSYVGVIAKIEIQKATKGDDADDAPGPWVQAGDPVTWTYIVFNSGTINLTAVDLSDDQGVVPAYLAGDNGDGILQPGEAWIYEATGIAAPGQYRNVGTVTAETLMGTYLSASDPSHYFGIDASIDIEKSTNGEDADSLPGPSIPAGAPVVWSYEVTNTGNAPLTNIAVVDDKLGPIPGPDSGDDGNGILDPGETWTYVKNGTAGPGEYTNTGTVTADDPSGEIVTDSDDSNYTGGIFDFGDAPAPYPTLLADHGAQHSIIPELRMGGKNDADFDGQPSDDADGDDLADTDDEDGVDVAQLTLNEGIIPKVNVKVRNTTGGAAWLSAWIDYNQDGAWEDSEQATAYVASGATTVELRFPRVPTQTISTTCTFDQELYVLDGAVRLLKYDLTTGASTVCADGFIGAHGMTADEEGNIYVADFGAATLYVVPAGCGEKQALTTWVRGGPPTPWALAYHNYYLYLCDRVMNRILEIDPVTGDTAVFIGDVVDPVAIAFDQDGFVYIARHNGAFLAKYDPSGNLIDPEFVDPAIGYADISGILVNPQAQADPIETYARFRISTDQSAIADPTGLAPDGEVEDYLVTIQPDNTLLYFTGNDANTVYGCDANGECVALGDFYANGLQNPFGLAMDCEGSLFISSSGSTSIIVLDPETGLSTVWDDLYGDLMPMAGPYGMLILDKQP